MQDKVNILIDNLTWLGLQAMMIT